MDINLEKYLKNPDICPFCDSENITTVDHDFSYINAYKNIICRSCDKQWTEEFTITKVVEDDE